jgi:DNA-binding transcriptional LysR family regulator
MATADFDWNDLRLVLAVARGGSLSAAARALGVNHSTVYRRLGALEQRLAVRLFDRLPDGQVPTAEGNELIAAAETMERETQGLLRRLSGRDLQLEGRVRLTAPDDLFAELLLPILAAFRRRYPAIHLEISLDNRFLSLTRREADVAVRPTASPPEDLVGRRIGPIASLVYGTPELAEIDPAVVPWIGWDEGLGPPAITRWFREHVAEERLVWRSNSLFNQAQAAAAGVGLALLPCFLGEAQPGLRRIAFSGPALDSDLWLLTHPDLRHSARVRALTDFLFDHLKPLRPLLAGERPQDPEAASVKARPRPPSDRSRPAD